MANPHCKCVAAGYCERHKLQKHTRQFHLCKGIADTPDCGFKYWRAWELGGMGATAVSEPVLRKNWTCDVSDMATYPNISTIGTGPNATVQTQRYLGDHVEQALSLVGVTKERVEAVLGNCGCCGRQAKLNELDRAAREILGGAVESGREKLRKFLGV